MNLEQIIAEAKLQEKWTVNHNFNYGPIDYLKEKVVDNNASSTWKNYIASLDVYEKNVHKVTDAETFFVYEHCKYDIYVDADYMVCIMRRCFPEVSFKQVCEWLKKHEEPHQYTNGISKSLVPKEYLENCN